MTNHKIFLLLAFALSVLLFSVLTVLFWTFMSDRFLIPIYYVVWVCGLIVNSIPQEVYLTLLVILGIIVGAKTFDGLRTKRQRQRVIHNQPNPGTRYLHWRTLCVHAYGSWFAKGQLAFEARKLILSILAFEQGVNLLEAEAMVCNGVLDIPDVLRQVVETKNIAAAPRNRFTGVLSRLRRPARRVDTLSDPYVEQFIDEFIRFVEHHLEITTHVGTKS